ncbi:MAG: hypothetical protein M3512_05775, partial [Bacteroidota bacterium]|nr:hypothetical protein [Bacteroidota bacterium]
MSYRSIFTFAISLVFLIGCSETGNEPNSDKNTHNTSQPSATSNTSNIKIDARSQIPPNRLNDGNLDSKLSKSSNVQQGNTGTVGEQAPAQTTQTIEGGQVD